MGLPPMTCGRMLAVHGLHAWPAGASSLAALSRVHPRPSRVPAAAAPACSLPCLNSQTCTACHVYGPTEPIPHRPRHPHFHAGYAVVVATSARVVATVLGADIFEVTGVKIITGTEARPNKWVLL